MRTIELARKLAEMGQKEDAQKGYFLALQKEEDLEPKEELEAASYLFFSKSLKKYRSITGSLKSM